MSELDPLRGIGHFTVGFLLGTLLFFILRGTTKLGDTRWALYGPFLPFALGAYAALPYLAVSLGLISHTTANSLLMNVFLAYGWLNQIPALQILGHFELSAALVGLAYLALCGHYIRFIKRLRLKHAQ